MPEEIAFARERPTGLNFRLIKLHVHYEDDKDLRPIPRNCILDNSLQLRFHHVFFYFGKFHFETYNSLCLYRNHLLNIFNNHNLCLINSTQIYFRFNSRQDSHLTNTTLRNMRVLYFLTS